jgi:hypothetical protein
MPPRSLRVVIAPDSFGGALNSVGVASAVANGWSRIRPGDTLVRAPMADGGEGTLAAVAEALGESAERRTAQVTDPLGRSIEAEWLLLDQGHGAFIELAAASGLARLASEERTPENAGRASTRGTGELMGAALDAGVQRVTVGLGGSATTDGGAGLLAALGLRVLDASDAPVADGGAALAGATRADRSGLDERLGDVAARVRAAGWDACVVVNAERVVLGLLRAKELAADPGLRIEQAMRPGPSTFRPHVPIVEMAHYMVDHQLDSSPITTSDGRLVGLLRRRDATRVAAELGRGAAHNPDGEGAAG